MSEILTGAEFNAKYGSGAKGGRQGAFSGGGGGSRGNKFGVSDPAQRTARGRVYASKAEKQYADDLWLRYDAGDVLLVVEQPRFRLGPDGVYVADFLIVNAEGRALVIDVKGCETPEFTRKAKLWRKYQRLPLLVVKKDGSSYSVPGEFRGADERVKP